MNVIVNINSQKFSFNGIPYFKNFTPHVIGDKLSVLNVYDSKLALCDYEDYTQFSVDGVVHANVADLQSALLPVLFTRSTLGGGGAGSQDIDETLGFGSTTDKSMTLKNTLNNLRKIVFNPNTINGPELQIWEDVDGVSTLLGSMTSYAFSMLYQALGGADFTWDPFAGVGITDGTQSIGISQYGLTVNGEYYEWPTTAGGGKIASEQFVNALLEGIKSKDPVRVATTANITLSGTQTIDGVALSAGDRVLVKNQTTQSQNGIYICAGGAWARSADANTDTELTNALVPVTEGTVNANTTYRQQTTSIVLGTSNIVFQTYGTLVPDADSSTKGKMKLYTAMGTATDGTITQALFKSEIDTLTTAVGTKKDADSILTVGGTVPAGVGKHYVIVSNTQTITDPVSPITGSQYTMFVSSCTLTLGGVAAYYSNAFITRYYNGVSWVNVVVADVDKKENVFTKTVTSSAAVTGTTSNTILISALIPANTFASGSDFRVLCNIQRVGGNSGATFRMYVNTSNSLSGATQLGTFTNGATNLFTPFTRGFPCRAGNLVGCSTPTSNALNDLSGTLNTGYTTQSFDFTVDNYIIIAVQPSSALDSFTSELFTIKGNK